MHHIILLNVQDFLRNILSLLFFYMFLFVFKGEYKIHTKKPVSESFFNKVAGQR